MAKSTPAATTAAVSNEKAPDPVVVATAAADQAPVLPFAPYTNAMSKYDSAYSPTLLAKSDDLAKKIWATQDGYAASQVSTGYRHWAPNNIPADTTDNALKNQLRHNRWEVESAIATALSVFDGRHPYSSNINNSHQVSLLIKKLKKLEKRYEREDLFDDEISERIVQSLLVPANQFTGLGYPDAVYVGLSYPPQRAVVNELLTVTEVQTIEQIVNYVSRLRHVMANFLENGPTRPATEKLLKPVLPAKDPKATYPSTPAPRDLLRGVQDLHAFFQTALPWNIQKDHVPTITRARESDKSMEKMRTASYTLRDETLEYAKEEGSLSGLLQSILDMSAAVQQYYTDLNTEVSDCFSYLSRVDLSFETFVDESAQRIEELGCPW